MLSITKLWDCAPVLLAVQCEESRGAQALRQPPRALRL